MISAEDEIFISKRSVLNI